MNALIFSVKPKYAVCTLISYEASDLTPFSLTFIGSLLLTTTDLNLGSLTNLSCNNWLVKG
jgi:hypothetical protein